MKHYSELIKARLENLTGVIASAVKGLIYFRSDIDRPYLDDGTDVSQLMLEKHLPEARRDTKVQLDDALTGNEITGVLPHPLGGTGIDDILGKAGQALIVRPDELGYEFGESGGGSLDFFYKENFEINDAADMFTGNDPIFLGGASVLTGALVNNIITPANGLRSVTYTQASGSLNDYIAGEVFEVLPRNRGQYCSMTGYFEYDGNNSEIDFFAYDVTNAQIIEGAPVEIRNTAGKFLKHEYHFIMPETCTQMQWGLQVKLENAGAVLAIDDIEFKANPLVPTEINKFKVVDEKILGTNAVTSGDIAGLTFDNLEIGETYYVTGQIYANSLTNCVVAFYDQAGSAGNTFGSIVFYDDGSGQKVESRSVSFSFVAKTENLYFNASANGSNFIVGTGSRSNTYIQISANKPNKGVVVKNRTDSSSVENNFDFWVTNNGAAVISEESIVGTFGVSRSATGSTSIAYPGLSLTKIPSVRCTSDDFGNVNAEIKNVTATGFDVRTYIASSDVDVDGNYHCAITKMAPDYIKETDKVYTVPVDNMTGNSIGLSGNDGRAITVNTESIPFGGAGIGWTSGLDGSTGLTGNYYEVQKSNSIVAIAGGMRFTTSIGTSAELYINNVFYKRIGASSVGANHVFSYESKRGEFSVNDKISIHTPVAGTLSNSSLYHYLNINESYGDRGAFIGTFGQPVAFLKDIKANNSAGGTFTSGAWITRELNTLEGDSSFLSLSANQFILDSGRYIVEGYSPGHFVNIHKAKIRNITDSVDSIIGGSAMADDAVGSVTMSTNSLLKGILNINASKVFEIQHRCNRTQSTTGFGLASNFGVSEVYTQLKITKVR